MSKGRTRRDKTLWATAINNQWSGARPRLSPEESLAAARKLWRHATGKAWVGDWALTSGRRHTWPVGRTYYVNSHRSRGEGGLREIIHEVSHYAHSRLHPQDAPHSIRQVQLEARLTKFAIARRWHEGTLAPKAVEPKEASPTKSSLQEQRATRERAALSRAEHRLKLAQAAVKRLSPKVRYYERALSRKAES